jgi:uncharacterized protein YdcH (DUF465 family)
VTRAPARSTTASPQEELEQLAFQHRRLDARLKELDKHLSLTPLEQVEYSRLKKEKLRAKDRIHFLQSSSA